MQEEGSTPLGAFPVRKTIDVMIDNEDSQGRRYYPSYLKSGMAFTLQMRAHGDKSLWCVLLIQNARRDVRYLLTHSPNDTCT